MTKFFGSAPGQDMSEVVQNLSTAHLRAILGTDIVSLVEAITSSKDVIPALRRLVLQQFRHEPSTMLSQPTIRTMCLDATPPKKLVELAERLNGANLDALRTLSLDQDQDRWHSFLEFYGLDIPNAPSLLASQEHERIPPRFGLFPHQRRVASQAYNAIRDGHGRLVLHMPTGAGKTRTAMHVVSRILAEYEPCVVLWMAASAELLEQAVEAFRAAWTQLGNREVSVTRCWGRYSPLLTDVNDGLVVAGLQKVHALNVRDPLGLLRFGSRVRLVVVDEAHQSIATTYREVIDAVAQTGKHTAVLGLTATPGRTWSDVDADKRLAAFFGERKVTVEIEGHTDPVSGLIEQGYMARPVFSRLEVEASPDVKVLFRRATLGEEYDDRIMDALATQVSRNVIILNELRRLMQEGHTRLMFFGSSVQHAKLIAAALSAVGIDAPLVTADTNTRARSRTIRIFRGNARNPIVLCNFGVLTAGFDAPRTSACVIARPTRSLVLYSQMVGRATRGPRAGGNASCAVSTVVDVDLPGFGDLAEAFVNWEDVWK